MDKIKIFSNPAFGEIRIIEETEKPLFAASDVAKVLGYTNPQKAVRDHCKGVTKRSGVSKTTNQYGITTDQTLEMSFIPESDVYRLVMRSKLPQAEQFQDWVCEEVLPSIRKNGGYIATAEDDTPETIMAKALLIAEKTMNNQKAIIEQQQATIRHQSPRVLFAQAVETSSRSILIGELAKILNQNGINIGQNRLFQVLRQKGYLGQGGEYYNIPTQRAMDLGLFEIKKTSITKPDGTVLVSTTTKVTGKGQIYFVNKFLKQTQSI